MVCVHSTAHVRSQSDGSGQVTESGQATDSGQAADSAQHVTEDMSATRHKRRVRRAQLGLASILPSNITSKLSCLALEEKRIGEVSMDPTLCADFLTQYKRKLKDNFLTIEFKVCLGYIHCGTL